LLEAQTIRNDADQLGDGKAIIYAGDFNIQSSSEGMYQELLSSGAGQAFDPLSTPGTWHNSSSLRWTHTQSPATSQQYPGQITGGMDDRFDFQLVSGELLDDEGLNYLDGSYHAFGNNGTHSCCNSSITTGSGASVAVLDALQKASDHLPVVADYQLPAWLGATASLAPATIGLNATAALELTVENLAPALSSWGADELDYTVSLSGDLLGTGFSGTDLALGGGQAYSVFLDSSTLGIKSGTITVASNSKSAANAVVSIPVSFTVGEGGNGGGDPLPFVAYDTFDETRGRIAFSQSPLPGAYSSPGDGFEVYQAGVSATIPFAAVDDSAQVFPNDTTGVIDSATKTDRWFGVVDTVNNDNVPTGQPGVATAQWQFDVAGASELSVSLDMGAMGDFEAGEDAFNWTWSIDGSDPQPLFASSVNEASSLTYVLADGDQFTLDDPLLIAPAGGDPVTLSNVLQTLTAQLPATGDVLTLLLTATTDSNNDEAYVFDNLRIDGIILPPRAAADFDGDGDVDEDDLAVWSAALGSDATGDAD
ncbi:MAG: hypothetical protein KDA61_23230, partial [Planctomycetales bacterium]|nr:hypothetical protein [Planctomycetales bacterium]